MTIQRTLHRNPARINKANWGRKRRMLHIGKLAVMTFIVVVIAIFLLATVGTVAHAAGLVDDTISTANEYSQYPLDNYQLDFYVDTGWDWLPWNWLDGIGKQVMYGLYAITNFIWTISLYLSNATGYLIQEAYSLDFISATADSIGKNMQTIAGVTANGLSTDGFYVGFLLLLILIMGIYVTYMGLIKRETTKAIHAVVNFVVVFVLSASFIAYAPDYITKINDFSADISNASLSLGTKIVLPNSESQGKDSVDLIRDSLFAIQVKQPWFLLQYNNTDIETIGADRVEALLSTSPDENNGEVREEIVIEEIEDKGNTNLTVTKTINRLGTVFFLFIFNIGISVFVFLLTGIMIFSQVLFILYAMFLPVSFILSMVPTFDGMSKRAITKLFNTILMRAGITLVITTAFSISTMLYTLSAGYPFFLIAFLQIVTFAGIYFKLGDLTSMFSLQSGESQSIGRQIMRKPRMLINTHMHRLQHKLKRSVATLGSNISKSDKKSSASCRGVSANSTNHADHTRTNGQTTPEAKTSVVKRAGQMAGTVLDTKDRIRDTAGHLKGQAKDLAINPKYAIYQGKTLVAENARDFTSSTTQTRTARTGERKNKEEQRRRTTANRRMEMEHTKQKKEPATESKKSVAPIQKRSAVTSVPQRQIREHVKHNQIQSVRSPKQDNGIDKPTERTMDYAGKDRSKIPLATENRVVKKKTPLVHKEQQINKDNKPTAHKKQQKVKDTISSGQPKRQNVQEKTPPSHTQTVLPDKRQDVPIHSQIDRQQQKVVSPNLPDKHTQHQTVKKENRPIKHESLKREKSRNTTTVNQKKG